MRRITVQVRVVKTFCAIGLEIVLEIEPPPPRAGG